MADRSKVPIFTFSVASPQNLFVPDYTDLKLHDITGGPGDPNREPVDMLRPPGSKEFLAGNGKFLTKRLWGAANEPPYFHHGLFTTLREAVLAHSGEALESRQAFEKLDKYEKDCVIEFLKSLQVLPPGTKHLVVDEKGRKKKWPPRYAVKVARVGKGGGNERAGWVRSMFQGWSRN